MHTPTTSSLGTPQAAIPSRAPLPISATVRSQRNVGPLDAICSIGLGAAGILYGILRRSPVGFALAALGGYLIARGLRRHDPLYAALRVSTATGGKAVSTVERSVIVNRPARDIYAFWRDLPNLPRFIPQLISVQITGLGRSHWMARAPFGRRVQWDAELTEDRPGEMLAWRSLPHSRAANAGAVRFDELPQNRGTEVRVRLEYTPPAGPFGAAIAYLADEEPHEQVAEALRRLKQVLEAGEVATTEGQPVGRRSLLMRSLHALQHAAW